MSVQRSGPMLVLTSRLSPHPSPCPPAPAGGPLRGGRAARKTARTRKPLGQSIHSPLPISSRASIAACAAPVLANVTIALDGAGRRILRTGPKRVLSVSRSRASSILAIPCRSRCVVVIVRSQSRA
jgi:hypothetical protein